VVVSIRSFSAAKVDFDQTLMGCSFEKTDASGNVYMKSVGPLVAALYARRAESNRIRLSLNDWGETPIARPTNRR
jgi:hypothetical protein